MTREKAKAYVQYAKEIEAYSKGKTIQYCKIGSGEWMDCVENNYPRFDPLDGGIYRIKPEPAKRLMTRNEVLGFVAHNPHIVVRNHGTKWDNAQKWEYNVSSDNYEWASITERGEIGEPHKFEVDDD